VSGLRRSTDEKTAVSAVLGVGRRPARHARRRGYGMLRRITGACGLRRTGKLLRTHGLLIYRSAQPQKFNAYAFEVTDQRRPPQFFHFAGAPLFEDVQGSTDLFEKSAHLFSPVFLVDRDIPES